jgi:hypothetical protein
VSFHSVTLPGRTYQRHAGGSIAMMTGHFVLHEPRRRSRDSFVFKARLWQYLVLTTCPLLGSSYVACCDFRKPSFIVFHFDRRLHKTVHHLFLSEDINCCQPNELDATRRCSTHLSVQDYSRSRSTRQKVSLCFCNVSRSSAWECSRYCRG